jgi:hypothetical protein
MPKIARNTTNGAKKWLLISAKFEGFDAKNKNPSRYCRCPGLARKLYQEGKLIGAARQEQLAVNVGPASWEEYEKSQELSEEELLRLVKERRDYYAEREQAFPDPMGKEAYYGIAGEVVKIIRPKTEACPEGILTQFLLGMMNIIGRGPYCRQAGVHHLNEFIVLVGETSIGAKGASWDATNGVLEAVDSDWFNKRIHTGVQSGEGVITWVRDSKVRTSRGRRIVIQGVDDKRLLIFEDEFPRLLTVAARQANILSPVLRAVFDGKRVLENGSKNDPETATDALISLLGHGTPQEMREKMSEVEAVNGLANRIMPIAVQAIGEMAIPPVIEWATEYPDIIARLQEIVRNFQGTPHTRLTWTGEGKTAWEQYYKEHRKRKFSGLIDPLIRRSLAHTLRLTMAYALLDNVIGMTPAHLAAARAIVDYSERSVQWTFGQKLGDKGADKIFWELDRRPLGMTRTEIRDDVFSGHISATNLNIKLALLRNNNLADYQLERTPGARKLTERWFSLRYLKKI